MKMRLQFTILLMVLIAIFSMESSANADGANSPYDLTGTWSFLAIDVQGSFCDGSLSRENVEFEISITQTGDEIEIVVLDDEIFEGRTSRYFIGAELNVSSALTVLSGRISQDADTIVGTIVFYDRNNCPDAETGYARYLLHRVSETDGQPYKYYVPLYSSIAGYATGIGLSNLNETETANVSIKSYDSQGKQSGTLSTTISPDGQKAEVLNYSSPFQGWTLVESDQPLAGLCFFASTGTAADNYMADVPITAVVSDKLQIPHVAYTSYWDTTIYIANPGATAQEVTIEVFDLNGDRIVRVSRTINAYGSGEYGLSEILENGYLNGGKVKLSASSGIVAFALYDNIKSGARCFAGISAVDTDSMEIIGNSDSLQY